MSRGALLLTGVGLALLALPLAMPTHGGTIRITSDAGFVSSGHFTGAGTPADPYRLTGVGTIVAASGYGVEITGTQAHVNLSGFTITGGSSHSDGLRLVNVRNVTVWGATFETNRYGVYLKDSANVTIGGNTIKTSQIGLYLAASRDVLVRDNKIALNDKDVAFQQATTNTLVNNNLTTATGQFGLHFEDNVSYDNRIDPTNTVNAIPVRWYTRLAGTPGTPVVIPSVTVDLDRMTNVAQIMVHNSSHVRLESPVAKAGNAAGIHVFQSASVELVRPTAEGNAGSGIFLERSTSTRISNASARENQGVGVLVQSSNGTTLEWSTLAANREHGARLAAASDVATLRQLTVFGNLGGGARVESSSNVTLESSSLTSNGATELALASSRGLTVRSNTLSGAGGTGIALASSVGRIEANTIRERSPAVSFSASTGSNLTDNVITIPSGGTGVSFDAPVSYNNAISPTNTVNGTAVRWYTNVAGTLASPIALPSLRVEAAGITNVAQIMLYRTANVTLTTPIAKNGSAAGIVVYQAHDSNVSSATLASNGAQGVLVHESRGARILGASITGSGAEGAKLVSSGGALLENNVVQAGRARGIVIETSDAPTLRGNAVTGNAGTGIHLDRIGPGGVAADNNVLQSNAGGGLVASQSAVGSILSNTFSHNGADGLTLSGVGVGARVQSNNVTNHTRGIRLGASHGVELTANGVTVLSGQTGFHFDDEISYNVTLPPSNTVNGVPMRWYVSTSGPVNISSVRAQMRGMSNVAQVMLYKVANVTLYDAVAANGSDRGVYAFRSENVTILASRAENNTRAGIAVESSRDVRVEASASVANAQEGLLGRAATALWASNSTFERNLGAGVSLVASPAPGVRLEGLTVRQNARGVSVGSSTFATIHANNLSDNGDAGLTLSSATGGNVTNNTLAGHTKGVELANTRSVGFLNNTVAVAADQTGYHFADEASYLNTINESNLVNGVPMRWYFAATGLALEGVRVELRGITNVAQIMLVQSTGTLEGVHAANGTARGLHVRGGSVLVNGSVFEANAGDGIDVNLGGLTLRNSTMHGNGRHGLNVYASGAFTVDNATFRANTGMGVSSDQASPQVFATLFERNAQAGLHAKQAGAVGSVPLNVTRSSFRGNLGGGVTADRPTAVSLYDNELAGNGAVGVALSTATAPVRVAGNRISDHTRGIEIAASEFGDYQGNELTILPGQTGWHFADEASYNNVIGTSNRVNGQPVHWYTTLTGTETSPVTLAGVRSELRGITNVAQVMVYRSSHVKIPSVVATNGTARGVYLYRSSSVTLDEGNASNNTLYGVHVHATQSSTIRNLSAQGSSAAVQLTDSLSNVVSRVNASGGSNGVVLQDAGSRDNRVDQVETNGTARSISDAAWNGQGLAGNNLLADAGAAKRVRVAGNVSFSDTTVTYRLESSRIASQTWSWGDGTASATSTAASLFRPSHAYATPGLYRANLTVATADGIALADSVLVDVVPPLSAPQDLVGVGGARNVTLAWTAPEFDGASAIQKYRLYRGAGPLDVPFLAEVTATTLSYVDVGLENGKTYVFAVSAVNADGEGPKAMAFGTPSAPPSAPTALTAAPSPNSVTLNWSAPADTGGLPITGYYILRTAGPAPYLTVASIGNVTNYTDTELQNGLAYTFAVRAANGLGSGPLSGNASATLLGPPSEPREVRALAGDASATVVWSAPTDNGGTPLKGYRVWRAGANGTLVALPDALAANASSFRATGLSNGQTYLFAISAVNDWGEGNRSANASAAPLAVDALPPVVFDHTPPDGAIIGASPEAIAAQFADNDGVLLESVRVYVDDAQVGANLSAAGFSYVVPSPLERGFHDVRVVLRDPTGNEANVTWRFRILAKEERVPVFEFSDQAVAPVRALPGTNVSAFVTVRNVGFATGNATVSALLAGNPLAHAVVGLAEGESAELVLEFGAPLLPGAYGIMVANATLPLVVTDPATPEVPPETGAAEAPPENATTPSPGGPRRPTRSTPPPRETSATETPGLEVALLLGVVSLAALRRRQRRFPEGTR